MKEKWVYKPGNDIVEDFLKSRGFASRKELDEYLNFDLKDLRRNYKDIDKVVSRIEEAVKNDENIVIYGDYDCDGICATAIIKMALRNIGKDVNFFINDRFIEGYGMNEKGVRHLLELYPDTDLIITVDNGIAAQAGIATALATGIDVVCTDHHLQKGDIIVPTVDEWRNDEDENAREASCGAEIARRVMLSLYEKMGIDTEYVQSLIEFSSIATVADVVRFTPANRAIVKRGLELLNDSKFPILRLIKQEMNIYIIDEQTLGFKYGPLMNALSRVTGSPDKMVEILTSPKNTFETLMLVREAVATNEMRKDMTQENYARAREEINEDDECIILAGEYDPGIAGIVCSSVVEDYYKPCICLFQSGDVLKGSARTYMDFHMKNALDRCADLLETYGGHAGAAGLSLKRENLEAFRERMCKLVKESGILEKVPEIHIDYVCTVSNMFDDNVCKLLDLAPFGEGFDAPKIVYTGTYKGLQFTPKDQPPKNVKFIFKDKTGEVETVWWKAYNRWMELDPAPRASLQVMGRPEINYFMGKERRQLVLDKVRLAN